MKHPITVAKGHLVVIQMSKSTSEKLKNQETNICEKAYVSGTFICSQFPYSKVCGEVVQCSQVMKEACVSNKTICD